MAASFFVFSKGDICILALAISFQLCGDKAR